MVTFPIKTKVLYFCSNTKQKYYDLYTLLRAKFDGLVELTVEDIESYLDSVNQKFYIKELSYQFELYNIESECVFCINKSIK